MRNLVLVLGDQLAVDSAAFDDFDSEVDAVWMAEVDEEATHVWCHKLRLAFFLSAMRHFRSDLEQRGRRVHYHELTHRRSDDRGSTFGEILTKDVHKFRPQRLVVLHPGDWRVKEDLVATADELGVELTICEDRHFYCSPAEFHDWAKDRKSLVLEHFYRHLRKKHRVLLTDEGEPVGGRWNYDPSNRESFGRDGPPQAKRPRAFQVDDITRDVLEIVEKRFPRHPGSLEHFDLPVTHSQAQALLRDFVKHRLALFGRFQDAMWTGEPFTLHSRLSAALNVHLLHPHDCVTAAVKAYEDGEAPLESVEGFVRQILGWREFIRGVYWQFMPDYADKNNLDCDDVDVPSFYWDGQTSMNCVRHAMQHVIEHAYAHHIERLMVLGLFAQLLGVHPRRFHEWHMAMYADAIDWVSLPNALGMSQHADGGIVGTKPYCASGNYIQRMSNYCSDCQYRYDEATGDNACPFTTLYWDFLARHRRRLSGNRRMKFQLLNLDKKSDELPAIREQAAALRRTISDRRPD